MARRSKKDLAAEEAFEQPAAEEYTEPAEEEAVPEEEAPVQADASEEPNDDTAVSGEEAVSEAPEQESAAAVDGGRGTVMKPVNFRTGPSFMNAVITELKPGTTLTIEETVEGDKGTWYRCTYDGVAGYVKTSGVLLV